MSQICVTLEVLSCNEFTRQLSALVAPYEHQLRHSQFARSAIGLTCASNHRSRQNSGRENFTRGHERWWHKPRSFWWHSIALRQEDIHCPRGEKLLWRRNSNGCYAPVPKGEPIQGSCYRRWRTIFYAAQAPVHRQVRGRPHSANHYHGRRGWVGV